MIAEGLAAYDEQVRSWWASIRLEPEKWQCPPWGDEGGGFWAVAVEGNHVYWYNDIEDGFNVSTFSVRGRIDEYWCNQAEFGDLLERVALRRSGLVWRTLKGGDVPAGLAGGGRIVRRQTTYWDLAPHTGGRFRVHFKDKTELAFAGADYETVELAAKHPLLLDYEDPWRDAFVAGTPINPRELTDRLDQQLRALTEGWRELADYATPEWAIGRLTEGHGLLMRAPLRVGLLAREVFSQAGVRVSLLGQAPAQTGMRALIMGRSFVIAREFGFVGLPVVNGGSPVSGE